MIGHPRVGREPGGRRQFRERGVADEVIAEPPPAVCGDDPGRHRLVQAVSTVAASRSVTARPPMGRCWRQAPRPRTAPPGSRAPGAEPARRVAHRLRQSIRPESSSRPSSATKKGLPCVRRPIAAARSGVTWRPVTAASWQATSSWLRPVSRILLTASSPASAARNALSSFRPPVSVSRYVASMTSLEVPMPVARCRISRSDGASAQCTSSSTMSRPLSAAASARNSRTDSNNWNRRSAGASGCTWRDPASWRDHGQVGTLGFVRLMDCGDVADELAEHPVRRAALILQGPGPRARHSRRGRARRRLFAQPGLADPRLTADEHDPALAAARRADLRGEHRELGCSPDERGA